MSCSGLRLCCDIFLVNWSCSKMLLAVLKMSLQWKASLPFLFRRWRGFSKTLISFLQTDESLGVEEKFSVFFCQACKLRSVLLTGSRSRRISSLRASKTTLFLTQTSFLWPWSMSIYNLFNLRIVWIKDLIVAQSNENWEIFDMWIQWCALILYPAGTAWLLVWNIRYSFKYWLSIEKPPS